MKLLVNEDSQQTACAAAIWLAERIRDAVAARGLCSLALSGGSTPLAMFEELRKQDIPWRAVHVFQVDERVAAAGSPARNFTHLHARLLRHVPIPSEQIHPMPVEQDDLNKAAMEYAGKLAEVAGLPPVLDIVHLGIGDDGHTASLVPGDPVLKQRKRDAAVTKPYQDHHRITLTYPCIARARMIMWLITGSDKAAMLNRLQSADPGIPAGKVVHDNSIAFVDKAAASGQPDGGSSLATEKMVLTIDVGGNNVKVMTSKLGVKRKFSSGESLSAKKMVESVKKLTQDWEFDCVSIGFPGPVRDNRPAKEPVNLGLGWVDFDFEAAFSKPVKIINDAAMQAVGSYQSGKMLFLGLGTGLGSAMIWQDLVLQTELAHLPYKKGKTIEDYVGQESLERLGKDKWLKHVLNVIAMLRAALLPDEIVLGGGNVRHIKKLPDGCRRGDNDNAFTGGFKLWQ